MRKRFWRKNLFAWLLIALRVVEAWSECSSSRQQSPPSPSLATAGDTRTNVRTVEERVLFGKEQKTSDPSSSVDVVDPEDIHELNKLKELNWKREKFVLDSVSPSVGERKVSSTLAQVSFRFRNVTATKDHQVSYIRDKWVNPPLLKRAVAIALGIELAGENVTSPSSESSESGPLSGRGVDEDEFWIELKRKERDSYTGLAVVKMSHNTVSVSIEEDGTIEVSLFDAHGMPEFGYESEVHVILSSDLIEGLGAVRDLGHWYWHTEAKPKTIGASTEIELNSVKVYGLGIYIIDIGDVDLRKGTFGADLQIFLLQYYRSFHDEEEAIREAMHTNRTCKDVSHGEKFQFIQNATKDQLQYKLNYLNAVAKPTPEIRFAQNSKNVFDHYRVRSTWRFSPQTEHYPFQNQELPLLIELDGQSVTLEPTALICTLEKFSGFAQNLSSLSFQSAMSAGGGSHFTGRFSVREGRNWPPLEGTFVPPYRFPHDQTVARQPTRKSSRLEWVVVLHRPSMIGVLEIAPALFVATSALITYVLPPAEFRAKITTCTTTMLAAVVQHSSIRSRIPERAVVTNADLVMLVIYMLILLATVSAVLVYALANHRRYGVYAERANNLVRTFGLLTPLLFLVFPLGGGRDFTSWLTTLVVLVVTVVILDCFTSRGRVGNSKFATLLGGEKLPSSTAYTFVFDHVDVPKWSALQVAQWIESLRLDGATAHNMRNYADLFFKERIDGTCLAGLKLENIKTFGVPLGHAMKILDAVKDLLSDLEPVRSTPNSRTQPTNLELELSTFSTS